MSWKGELFCQFTHSEGCLFPPEATLSGRESKRKSAGGEEWGESETYPRKMGELPRPINQQRRQRYETFQTADVVQLLSSKDLYCVFTTFHHKIGSDREKDKSN